jgi:hypothetical protein
MQFRKMSRCHSVLCASSIVAVLAFAAAAAQSQQASPRPAYDGSGAPDVAREIHVDGSCRILPDGLHPLGGKKGRPFRDSNICHIEGTNNSQHMEERISANQLLRSWVRISEQTFVLQNITSDHIVFVVEVTMPNGWTIDSDPQPNRYEGPVAIFPLHAQPGEMVRFHMGMRRATALKPKTISSN